MAKITLRACEGCALSQPYLRESVARLIATHGDALAVVSEECLDVCLELGAFKLGEEPLLVAEDGVKDFEAAISEAVLRGASPRDDPAGS
jgi:hypothetical protein